MGASALMVGDHRVDDGHLSRMLKAPPGRAGFFTRALDSGGPLGYLCLARSIHEDFYCNRRYAATTSLTAGGLAAQSVNILFKYASFLHGSARPSRVASRRFRHELS